jgi:hypothetical protein
MVEAGFALINLTNQDSFVFQFFPKENRTTDRANWNAQDTTIGTKPLFYANREPRLLEFQELYLDNTDTNESLTPTINQLRSLMDEVEQRGTPPPLLAVWGDRNERCVLQDLNVEEIAFDFTSGAPLRVRISLSLLQIQPDSGETTSVRVNEE